VFLIAKPAFLPMQQPAGKLQKWRKRWIRLNSSFPLRSPHTK